MQKHVVIHTDNDVTTEKKPKKRPMTAKEKALHQKQSDFNSTTRWLADSAFTTYYGKPAFHAYGKGNIKPVNPNQKLMTHNINAVTGKQKAMYTQVYDSALLAGIEQTKGVRIPKIPKTQQVKEKNETEKGESGFEILPKTYKEQVETTKKILKKGQVSIKISKPKHTIGGFKVSEKDIEKKKTLK